MSHTPGPWKVYRSYPSKYPFGIVGPNGRGVLNSRAFARMTTPEAQANVHLIAAAPEYDAAARWLVERHDLKALAANFDACGCEDCLPFRAAIAKAEGR